MPSIDRDIIEACSKRGLNSIYLAQSNLDASWKKKLRLSFSDFRMVPSQVPPADEHDLESTHDGRRSRFVLSCSRPRSDIASRRSTVDRWVVLDGSGGSVPGGVGVALVISRFRAEQ
jgi:hypothetical protein